VKIVFVSPYPPERDGVGTYSKLLQGGLEHTGLDVRVVSARPNVSAEPEVIASLSPSPMSGTDAARAAIEQFAPDLVHVQFAVASYGPRLISVLSLIPALRRAGIPVVATLHEVTRDTARLKWPGRLLYRHLICAVDAVIVHTERAQILATQLGGGRRSAVRIPHPQAKLPVGIDPQILIERHRLAGARVVLFLGFVDIDKGLDVLVDAFVGLPRTPDAPPVRLVVAGAVRRRFGPMRLFEWRDRRHLHQVQRALSRSGRYEETVFTGFVPDSEMRAWLELATVLVLPYRRSEQSGIASLAAAARTPILTTTAGELAPLSSFPPVAPGDVGDLSQRLEEILDAPDHRRSPGHTGADLDQIVGQTVTLYRRVSSAALSTR
jgi:glycosyltransferase involved in cell wall biosynthesis